MYLGTVALGGSAGEHDDHLLSARTDSEEEEPWKKERPYYLRDPPPSQSRTGRPHSRR
jgi:hypothetical protein